MKRDPVTLDENGKPIERERNYTVVVNARQLGKTAAMNDAAFGPVIHPRSHVSDPCYVAEQASRNQQGRERLDALACALTKSQT